MRILYFDCSSGICGDMVLGAFIDLGVDLKKINAEISKLNLPENPKLIAKRRTIHSLFGTNVIVKFIKQKKSKPRSYREIKSLIEFSSLSKPVKAKSLEMFDLIGKVESKIHGVPLKKIHFHEIGAVDSIADVVGVTACFEMLKPAKFYFSKIPVGGGVIKAAHGSLPLPAPAATLILRGAPIYGVDTDKELVTPTGAAIVKVFADGFSDFPSMTLEEIGTGFGKRRFNNLPGILRVFEGVQKTKESDSVYVVEANIDDFNPEFYGHVFDALFEKGALDVFLAPILMKKGRPGHILSAICDTKELQKIMGTILSETTTTGLRYYQTHRKKLKREIIRIKTPYGTLNVKKIITSHGVRLHPEYEDLKRLAKRKNIPITKVQSDVLVFLASCSDSH